MILRRSQKRNSHRLKINHFAFGFWQHYLRGRKEDKRLPVSMLKKLFSISDSSSQMVLVTSGLGESLLAETEMWTECLMQKIFPCTVFGKIVYWWKCVFSHILCNVYCASEFMCAQSKDRKANMPVCKYWAVWLEIHILVTFSFLLWNQILINQSLSSAFDDSVAVFLYFAILNWSLGEAAFFQMYIFMYKRYSFYCLYLCLGKIL